jgi:DtxR family Mn-dependent transcriptional regulator
MVTTPGVTSTLESYLEAIFELDEIDERVSQARLARWFGVSPPATLEVVRRLEKLGLITFEADRAIVLTATGRSHAQEMARRHRVIERYLTDVLGVRWHLADEEARRLEPGVSDVIEERMRAALPGVDRCPHGNPIPGGAAAGPAALTPLDGWENGDTVRIDRIREDLELDLGMLRYLEEHKLLPGVELTITGRGPEGGVSVKLGDEHVAVGPVLASHVLCVAA